jgi:hypothetical protein
VLRWRSSGVPSEDKLAKLIEQLMAEAEGKPENK